MKIAIQTWGSNGDIRPMIALATGLQEAGHQVALVVSSLDNRNYSQECASHNIQYQQIPELFDFDLEAFAEKTFRMNAAQWLVALLDTAYFPYEEQIYAASQQLAKENDILIGHHFLYPLKIAAAQNNKPFYSITLCHAAIRNNLEAPFMFPQLGKYLNTLQWHIFETLFDIILKKKLTRLWNQQGMPKIKHILSSLLCSDTLNLVAVDPVFCPKNQDWAEQHYACGFLNFASENESWQINTALQTFLKAGPAPVYMTFGSLQQSVPEWSMEIFIKATQLSGCRAIIQTSSTQFAEHSQLENIYFIGRHPHQNLFKHCAAVVHHGGAGTTHSATLSGCPSIVVPFMDEQLFWARALQKLNIAGKAIPAKNLTAENLANAILQIQSNNHYQKSAQYISHNQFCSSGVSQAVKLIERAYADNA